MTDTRKVLLKCRHSVLSMIGHDAAAGHVVLVECHRSVLSMIRAVLLWWSCVCFFLSKLSFFISPGTWYSYCYGLAGTTPNRSIHTHQKVQEMRQFMLAFFFVPSTRIFCALLCQAPSLSYPGSHDTHSSPFPLPCVRSF